MIDSSKITLACDDPELIRILEEMIEKDETITLRKVAERHPKIKAASSISRVESRASVFAHYKSRQISLRKWSDRVTKTSARYSSEALARKEAEIEGLKRTINALTLSHVSIIRIIGEMGGFARWAQFFAKQRAVIEELERVGAIPPGLGKPTRIDDVP